MDDTEEKVGEKVEKAGVYTPQDFVDLYKELCDRTGFNLAVVPSWRQTNHGSYEMVVNTSVVKTKVDTPESL